MAMQLWINDEEDINLGDPFLVYRAFAEMARAVDSDEEYADIFALPQFAEQTVDQKWLKSARAQATRLLAEHDLTEHARWVLEQLVGESHDMSIYNEVLESFREPD